MLYLVLLLVALPIAYVMAFPARKYVRRRLLFRRVRNLRRDEWMMKHVTLHRKDKHYTFTITGSKLYMWALIATAPNNYVFKRYRRQIGKFVYSNRKRYSQVQMVAFPQELPQSVRFKRYKG